MTSARNMHLVGRQRFTSSLPAFRLLVERPAHLPRRLIKLQPAWSGSNGWHNTVTIQALAQAACCSHMPKQILPASLKACHSLSVLSAHEQYKAMRPRVILAHRPARRCRSCGVCCPLCCGWWAWTCSCTGLAASGCHGLSHASSEHHPASGRPGT